MTKARDLADLLDASGNIIARGNIDGRDIASDGSKLDSIEHGATGDQTHSEIRALITAGVDTNVFTDADHSKLDGIEAGATADQTKADIDALNVDADTLDGQHGSYYTSYADTAVANIVDSAPGTLDTLNELAAALGDDPNFATTTATNIGTKANKTITVSAGSGLTGGGDLTANRTISHADTSTVSDVNGSGNTFIQDIGFDTYGHVTSVGTGTVTVGDGAMTVTAGSGLSGGGQLGTANQSGASSVTVSHADTSSQASVNNSDGTVIQDITLDTYGHLTGITSYNLDGRYYTGTAADSRFFRSNASNSVDVRLASGNGRGLRFWDSDSYKIYMSTTQDGNWGGRLDSTSDYNMYFRMTGGTNRGFVFNNGTTQVYQIESNGQTRQTGPAYVNTNQRVFADDYHPNADKWTTARTLSLSGDASGSVSWDGSGNATLSVTVADDSHNHIISNVDGLQTALDGKLSTSGKAADSNLLDGLDLHTGRNNVANRVVRTQSNGYCEFGWINTTSGDTTSSLSRVYVDTGDNYIRKCTLAHLASQGGFAGDITNVSAGTNLTGGGSSGSVTLNVTASPTFTTVTATTFNTTSDRNAKKDITPITDAVSKVQQLGGYNFTFKHNDEKSSGVIAQEVQKVMPELVQEGGEGHLTVQYGNMVGLLIEAIKEQQVQIDELKAQLNS